MAELWNILYGGELKSLSAWALNDLVRTLVNQNTDTVAMVADGQAFDADEQFAYGETVKIFRGAPNATKWFQGKVIKTPRYGVWNEERVSYVVAGPWYDLERITFMQDWQVWEGAALATRSKSRVILGHDGSDVSTAVSVKEVLEEIFDYAIAAGADFQVGTIDPTFKVWWEDLVDVKCAEAVRSMLRLIPEAVTVFDYSTTPPTLHVRLRANLPTVGLAVASGQPTTLCSITPRYDMVVPAVVLHYEQRVVVTDGTNQITYESLSTEKHPSGATGKEPGALVATVRLRDAQFVGQTIKTEALPADLNSEPFWMSKLPFLLEVSDLVITGGSKSGDAALLYELIEGAIPDWLVFDATDNPTGVKVDRVVITAEASYRVGSGSSAQIVSGELLSVVLTAVDVDAAAGKTYAPPEPDSDKVEQPPAGLALQLYNTLSALKWEGEVHTVVAEVDSSAVVGKLLNFSDARDEWKTMNALIQETTERIDDGFTRIKFGPPRHLSPQDLQALLSANRRRRVADNFLRRATGKTYGP